MNIGERIAELRKQKNLSQQELANKLNVSNKTISKWERGNGTPDVDTLIKLSKVFNISLDEFINDNSKNEKPKNTGDVNIIHSVNKKNIIIGSIIGIVLLLAVVSILLYFYIPRSPELSSSKNFVINPETSTATCSVDNNITQLSLNDEFIVPMTNEWSLYSDINGLNEIKSKLVELNIGDNTFYVIVKNSTGNSKIYTITIRRKPMYTIKFNTNGGQSIVDKTIQEGDLLTYQEPVREGYIFNGWDYDFSKPIESNITINASWIAKNLEITYWANNGTENNVIQEVIYDGETYLKGEDEFYLKGYSLIGWNTNQDGSGISYSNNLYFKNYNIPENLTLYAQWKINKYDIQIDKNMNSAGQVYGEGSYNYQSTQTISIETNDGYTWLGWYTVEGDLVSTATSLSITLDDFDVYYIAKWKANEYDVFLNVESGDTLQIDTIKIIYGNEFVLPKATKYEASFIGWFDENNVQYTDSDGNSIKDWDIANNTTLYAHYKLNEYEVNLTVNNEKAGNVFGNGFKEYSTIVEISATTNNGYNFVGWYNESNLLSTNLTYSFTMPNYSITYTAKWEENPYTLTLNVNNGDILEENTKIVIFDHSYTLPIPTRNGYNFEGWYLGQNASGTQLTDSYGNSLSSWNIAEDVEVFAKWRLIEFDLEFTLNNGTLTTENPSTYTIEDLDIKINNPVRDGYIFEGWVGTGLSEPTKDLTIFAGSYGDKIFGACWVRSDEFIAISNPNDLKNISNNLNGYYYLTQNIDMTDIEFSTIGDEENSFTGIIDGNNFTISNLTLEKYFIYTLEGEIFNLEIKNINVTGDSGTMLVHTNNGIIRNCKLNGIVDVTGDYKSVEEDNTAYASGIAIINNGLIENVIISGEIKAQGPNNSSRILDRIVSNFAYKNTGTIRYCYSEADVSVEGTYGMTYGVGFVYKNDGEIQNTFICGNLNVSGWGSGKVPQRCGVYLYEFTRYQQTGMENCYILESSEITLYESGQIGGYYPTLSITKVEDSKIIDNSLINFGKYIDETDVILYPNNVWIFDGITYPKLYW